MYAEIDFSTKYSVCVHTMKIATVNVLFMDVSY